MTEQSINELAKSIRTVLCGVLIVEYGLMSIPDQRYELKNRVNTAIKKCRDVQSYFENSPHARPEIKQLFKREFLKSEQVLITEILEAVYGLSEQDLEMILNSLKENITQ